MKLEKGLYVRTEEGKIFKTDGDLIYLNNDKTILHKIITRIPHDTASYKVVKASSDVIDILQVGDIITFKEDEDVYKVLQIPVLYEDEDSKHFYLVKNYDGETEDIFVEYDEMKEYINSITTKEQFEKISYKLEE